MTLLRFTPKGKMTKVRNATGKTLATISPTKKTKFTRTVTAGELHSVYVFLSEKRG